MTGFLLRLGLLLAGVASIAGRNLFLEEFEEFPDDVELINIGSDLSMLGKPKLKITEDYNGYWSVYIGYGNKRYINFKFNDRPSVDFNILNHEGSFKVKDEIFGSDENQLLVEGEIAEAHPCQFCVLEGTMKMKVKATPNDGPIVIEFSKTFTKLPKSFLEFPTVRIREMDSMEISLKVVIVPKNPVESRADLAINIKAKKMQGGGTNFWTEGNRHTTSGYVPGHYNLTAAMKLTKLDELRKRQPKFSAKLDLSENKHFGPTDIMEPNFDSEQTFRGKGDDFRRSFNLDGMINLSGQGKRLAVLRVSDADTDKTLGRMQARFTDADNLWVENYIYGDLMWALNWHTTNTSSSVGIHTYGRCPNKDINIKHSNISNGIGTPGYNQTNNGPSSNFTLPHLSEFLGQDVESEDVEEEKCNIQRLWETKFNDETVTTTIYQDLFLLGKYGRRYRSKIDPSSSNSSVLSSSKVFEESMTMKNDGYKHTLMLSDGFEGYEVACNVNYTDTNKTEFEVGVSEITLQDAPFSDDAKPIVSMKMEMDDEDDEKFKAKLQKGTQKIFDGWFYDLNGYKSFMKPMLKQILPSHMSRYMEMARDKEYRLYHNIIGRHI